MDDKAFPDWMPSEVLSVIESSIATHTDPTLMTKNALRLAMASPFYNLN